MGIVIAGMAMSLDGFVNDRNGDVSRLYPDLDALRETDILQEDINTTGAVVMGRRAYDMAQGDFTGYEFQVPIFVLTHTVPQKAAKGENEMKNKMSVKKIKPSEQQESNLPAGIASPARRALVQAGYTRLEQLTALSEAEVMQLHGIGPNALAQLHRALSAKGLSFADEK